MEDYDPQMTAPNFAYTQAEILNKVKNDRGATEALKDRANELSRTGMCWSVSVAWLNHCVNCVDENPAGYAAAAQRHGYLLNNNIGRAETVSTYDAYLSVRNLYLAKNQQGTPAARVKRRKAVLKMTVDAPNSGLTLELAKNEEKHRELDLSTFDGDSADRPAKLAGLSARILLGEMRGYSGRTRGWLINVNAFDPGDQENAELGTEILLRHTVGAFRQKNGGYALFDPNYGEWTYDDIKATEALENLEKWLREGVLGSAPQEIRRISWVVVK